MFKKIKPERVAGIVALSYLVLIPVGAIFLYRRIQMLDREIADLVFYANKESEKET